MKNVYNSALTLINRRIKSCGKGIKSSQDEHSLFYWKTELNKAEAIKSYIEKRMPVDYNVIFIDFKLKKRVA